MAVQFFFNDVSITLKHRKRLKEFIKTLFMLEGKILRSLNYIFCADSYLVAINNDFLKHDDYTDIITFILSDPLKPVEGEIYISTDRIRSNATILKVGIKEELHRVIFHGALHLCGYNDKSIQEKKQMTASEDRYLRKYFE
ncbi:MAG: rRNA maturation RNase YbeY [Ferruginibacter sp.]